MSAYRLDTSSELPTTLSQLENRLATLLHKRGVVDAIEIEKFLNPSYDDHLHDPFLLHGMDKAVERLSRAIQDGEMIVIFSDYDCDGIPGAVVLYDFLTSVGHEKFFNHIPHRHYDGFGLSVAAVEAIKEKHNPGLIITIDCGTTDLEAVERARALGIDVIITDHHEPKDVLPKAVAVVNPKVGNTYPFTGLCGAAVVFKLVQAMLIRGSHAIAPGQEKWWLDMVGIATIADMVPLLDENRVLASYGLKVLRKSRRPGLQQLFRAQKAHQAYLTEDDVGFTIAPRINAASRMDTPEDAFWLLAVKDEGEAGARLKHLESLNQARKTAVAQMTREVHQRLGETTDIPPVIVLGNPDWRPSLVGLAANKLAEENNRPAFLWGRDGNGAYKGSCRSGGGVSVVSIMNAIPEVFKEFGGHHHSGGFTVLPDAIYDFGQKLNEAYLSLGAAAAIAEELMVDLELSLDDIDNALIKAQRQLAPFGHSNQKPVYLFKSVRPTRVEVFGKGQEHTKLSFSTRGLAKEAIAFFKQPTDFKVTPSEDMTIDLLAHLEESYFMNRLQTRLRIVDIVN